MLWVWVARWGPVSGVAGPVELYLLNLERFYCKTHAFELSLAKSLDCSFAIFLSSVRFCYMRATFDFGASAILVARSSLGTATWIRMGALLSAPGRLASMKCILCRSGSR